jgi:hypothetical protein
MSNGRHRRPRGGVTESDGAVAMMGTETSCVGRLDHGRRIHADEETAYLRKCIHGNQLSQGMIAAARPH